MKLATFSRSLSADSTTMRQAGFTIIELMVAITISLLVIAALAVMFAQSSRSRNELEQANQQIENGRYALVTLNDDLQVAGFLERFNITGASATAGWLTLATKPAPCATALASLRDAMTLPVQGYDNVVDVDADGDVDVNDNAIYSCLSDIRPNTDIILIRRVSTCIRDTSAGSSCPNVPGAPYFQASTCAPETGGAELSNLNPNEWYRLDTTIGSLDRRRRGVGGTCVNFAPLRQFMTHIYFVANNLAGTNDGGDGDGIPTLKRVDLGAGGTFGNPIPIAGGIENLQFEYGIDANPIDGMPDIEPDGYTADPDTYNRTTPATPFANCAANANCLANWRDVMVVRIYLLARNTLSTAAYVDNKLYDLGSNADGNPECAFDVEPDGTCDPFNDNFKRHAYQAAVRLTNPAGLRE